MHYVRPVFLKHFLPSSIEPISVLGSPFCASRLWPLRKDLKRYHPVYKFYIIMALFKIWSCYGVEVRGAFGVFTTAIYLSPAHLCWLENLDTPGSEAGAFLQKKHSRMGRETEAAPNRDMREVN